jgi:hypothetical protein
MIEDSLEIAAARSLGAILYLPAQRTQIQRKS